MLTYIQQRKIADLAKMSGSWLLGIITVAALFMWLVMFSLSTPLGY